MRRQAPAEGKTVVQLTRPAHRPIYSTAREIAALCGGGTSLAAPVEWLLQKGKKVDVFVGITDEEEWSGRGFLPAWREYKKLAPGAQAFLVKIAPYRHAVAPRDEPDCHFIYGWSNTVLPYITSVLEGSASQLDAVRAIRLDDPLPNSPRSNETDETHE